MAYINCCQHLEIFWVSLIFQRRFQDAVSRYGRWTAVSTSGTRSHIATTKQPNGQKSMFLDVHLKILINSVRLLPGL